MTNEKTLTPVEWGRIEEASSRLSHDLPDYPNTWYVHSILAQCFLPYRDPKSHLWERRNGDVSISISAGRVINPNTGDFEDIGLPYGAKPRLFQSYICTSAVRNKSPVVAVEDSMTAVMKGLGLKVTGGQNGSISGFKEQIKRYAAANFVIAGPSKEGDMGSITHLKASPIKKMELWFPGHHGQKGLWPSEIVLTDEYYDSLRSHAIPYDYRSLKLVQNNPRAQDFYLWLTQRLCRIQANKPLFMTWNMLYEMYGGGMSSIKMFVTRFKETAKTVSLIYRDARMSVEKDGMRFYHSPPPIPREQVYIKSLPRNNTLQAVEHEPFDELPELDDNTYAEVKKVAPGLDVKFLETEWRAMWVRKGKLPLKNPSKAFIGYCRKIYLSKGVSS